MKVNFRNIFRRTCNFPFSLILTLCEFCVLIQCSILYIRMTRVFLIYKNRYLNYNLLLRIYSTLSFPLHSTFPTNGVRSLARAQTQTFWHELRIYREKEIQSENKHKYWNWQREPKLLLLRVYSPPPNVIVTKINCKTLVFDKISTGFFSSFSRRNSKMRRTSCKYQPSSIY